MKRPLAILSALIALIFLVAACGSDPTPVTITETVTETGTETVVETVVETVTETVTEYGGSTCHANPGARCRRP